MFDPQDGDFYPSARWVVLRAQAYDQDDEDLVGDSLVWMSDVDGLLGTGTEVEPGAMSTGDHVITLTATDSDGLSSSQSVAISIGHHTCLPLVVK